MLPSFFTFEPTVTAGAVLQTVVLLGAMVRGWVTINNRISTIEVNIRGLERSSEGFAKSFEQLSKVLTQVAVQDNRILNIERRYDELAHGRGFIK
jgi:hypothetical protein